MFTLRPYQNRCCNAVERAFSRDGFSRALAVLATAAGKTVIFSRLSRHWIQTQDARVLILADRDELISQAVAKLKSAAGLIAAVEKAEHRAMPGSPVVVSSIQTMARRLDKWTPGCFTHIICDEAHLALAANWQAVLNHLTGPVLSEPRKVKVLGVTATPFRADKKRLCDYFQTVAYEHSCFDLIGEGYLAPIKVRTLPIRVDLNAVKTKAGDLDGGQLSHAIEPYFEAVADALKVHASGRRILAFLPLCATSEKFAAICNARGLRARHIAGDSPDRGALLAEFARVDASFDILCNASLLSTGVDIERIDAILNLSPTKSATLYQQRIGRGTRILPGVIDGLETPEERRAAIAASAKPDCLILDCLWQYEKLGVQRPANLFAATEEEATAVRRKLEASDEDMDLIGVGRDVAADREEALRRDLLAKARRRGSVFDAATLAAAVRCPELLDYEPVAPWEHQRPTVTQGSMLRGYGVAGVDSRGMASQVIGLVKARTAAGLARPWQLRALVQAGHTPEPELTYGEAAAILNPARYCAPGASAPAAPELFANAA